MADKTLPAESCGAVRRAPSLSLHTVVLTPAVALALCFPCSSQALTQSVDAAKGADTAARLCDTCHALHSSTGSPPSLAEIANTPHYSTQKLRRIIAVPPHRAMPGLGLKPQEINDLAAYIRSLRKGAP
jgi:mono/diheme cytochrome c family protein